MDIKRIKEIFNEDSVKIEDLFWCIKNIGYIVNTKKSYTNLDESKILILKELYINEKLRSRILKGFGDYQYETKINSLYQLAKGCEILINCEDVLSFNKINIDPLVFLSVEDENIQLKEKEVNTIFNNTTIENIFSVSIEGESYERILKYLPNRIQKNITIETLTKCVEENLEYLIILWEIIKIYYYGIEISELVPFNIYQITKYENEYIIDIPIENKDDAVIYRIIFGSINFCTYYDEEKYNEIVQKYTSDKKYEERLKILLKSGINIRWENTKKQDSGNYSGIGMQKYFFSPFLLDSKFFDEGLINESKIPNEFLDKKYKENLVLERIWKKRNEEKFKKEIWAKFINKTLDSQLVLNAHLELDKDNNYVLKNLDGYDFKLYGSSCPICYNKIGNIHYLCIFGCTHIVCRFCKDALTPVYTSYNVHEKLKTYHCPCCRKESMIV